MEGFASIFKATLLLVLVNLGCQQDISKRSTGEDTDAYFYYQQSDFPKDCFDIYSQCDSTNIVKNGVYYIKPEGLPEPFEAYCDHDDGGWTVIQRRINGEVDFTRPSADKEHYRGGFGFPHKDFWMSNEYLAYLVNQRRYQLKIELTEKDGSNYNVTYNCFRISDKKSEFKLVYLEGFESSDASITDEMATQGNGTFYGSERSACSNRRGWWFNSGCSGANLNGAWGAGQTDSIEWGGLDLSKTVMKVKPFQEHSSA